MNEDPTKKLTNLSFQEQVLAELAGLRGQVTALDNKVTALDNKVTALDNKVAALTDRVDSLAVQQTAMAKTIATLDRRLTSLEERVDLRLKETRPIWEAVKGQIEKLDEKFDNVIRDLYDVRGDVGLHHRRLTQLERLITP
jgi:predicted  nucleic acid-binding Zn-ribbon protein